MDFAAESCVREKASAVCRILWPVLYVLTLGITLGYAHQSVTYTNPVIPGDYPDPSVIRVGKEFWATATSSEWGPQFPLLRSLDLVNWRVAGAVFQHPPEWSASNYWAPEITRYGGQFFIYYAARKKGGPLCVAVASADRPIGPYKDHGPLICQEAGSIDPFPVTDESGRRYLLWKEDGNSVGKPTPIWAQQLSDNGTQLIGERRELIRNTATWEGQLVEGPSVIRHNGWFYLFYSGNACCGRECNYALGVARSRKLFGPWEKNPANPILARNDQWKCPGHGTVVEVGGGRFFLLYHAYQPTDFVYVGRQALLDQVVWNNENWPVINDGKGPVGEAMSPFGARQVKSEYTFFDQFKSSGLKSGWQWPLANKPIVKVEVGHGGWLFLTAESSQADEPPGAVLARSTTTGNYVVTTSLDINGMKEAGMAGLWAFGDFENALGISVDQKKTVVLWRREKNQNKSTAQAAGMFDSRVYLRMTAHEGHLFRFALSGDGRNWTDIAEELDGSFLPPWDRGVRIALVVGGAEGATAKFDWLRITPAR